MILIIDYGMGNLRSLINAFRYLGERVKISESPKEIKKGRKIVFPGVGHFGRAMKNLKKKKLDLAILKIIEKGIPFLGICLGFQLLFEKSEEDPKVKGLAVLKGKVLKFKKIKTPHIGWNKINIKKRGTIFKGIKNESFLYFMHSFYLKVQDEKMIAATTDYGKEFCSAIELKNIFGVQFHPEKSGKIGLKILKNFIEI